MADRDGFSGFGVFLAFLGGALAGAATALLVAPAPGDEAREKIRDAINKVPGALKSAYAHASEVAHQRLSGEVESGVGSVGSAYTPIEKRNGEI
jgi:gas vesicle protein